MSRRALRWVTAVAALPLLLLAVSTGALAMRCRALGVVVSSCCCPKPAKVAAVIASQAIQDAQQDERADRGELPALRAAGCCDVEASAAAKPDVESAPSFRWLAPALLAHPGSASAPSPTLAVRLPCEKGRAPPPRTPILLAKQSLLL